MFMRKAAASASLPEDHVTPAYTAAEIGEIFFAWVPA